MTTKTMAASIIIAIMMVAAIFVTTAAAFTAPNADNDRVEFEYSESNCDGLYVNLRNCTCPSGINDTPTLRIYGEGDADAAFPYNDSEGPFDPTNSEAPCKDFVVFNPAYIGGHEHSQYIKVATGTSLADANEKIFVRQWYVPEYPEPRGDVWLDSEYYDIEDTADIVTEYSFMLLEDGTNDPTYGYAGTRLYLPIGSNDTQIGLDSFKVIPNGTTEIVEIKEISDFNGDGMKDINVGTTGYITVAEGDRAEFLDHEIYVNRIWDGGPAGWLAEIYIYYIGNDASFPESGTHGELAMEVTLNIDESAVAGRSNAVENALQSFNMPWKVTLSGVDVTASNTDALVTFERRIHMQETFFVDGAEYDVAMIYGPEPDPTVPTFTTFKYITIRNPTPKYDEVYINGLSIWKQPVVECENLPVLPPFNMNHTMVDDINLPDCYTGCTDDACDNIFDDTTSIEDRWFDVGELEIMFAKEDTEPRFHTNLLEILKEPEEIWQWIHIHIMPENYTELVYPPLDDANVSCPNGWYKQPGDFLLVSSWEAPNSCGDRMKFAYDANNSSDIYVNEQDECGNNSVRIYGEGDADAAFPYNDSEGPFNKLSGDAPRKDFVTFNPAYIGGHEHSQYIKVATGTSLADANEKIFVRQWYVPEYPEPRGDVWLDREYYDIEDTADIVTEYSFMLLEDGTNDPTYGYAGTRLYLPIGSNDTQIGLDSFKVIPNGTTEIVEIKEISDFNGDGMKDINVGTTGYITVAEGDRAEFLDHEIYVNRIWDGGPAGWLAEIYIYYIGNDASFPESGTHGELAMEVTLNIDESAVAGRSNAVENALQSFNMPWKVTLSGVDVTASNTDALVTFERRIHMQETFFVDGAEYDVAMIYGPEPDPTVPTFTTFKYITIRNPTPKYDEVYINGLSIWKQPVVECDNNSATIADIIPMLPPFNMVHNIVDDIGIPHDCPGPFGDVIQDEPTGIDSCADTVAERIVTGELAFVSYFVEETVEKRFRTNLLEILDEDTTESWNMLCMWTLPWNYTAMVYPNVGDCACCGKWHADADFLVTTSGPALPTSEPKPDLVITAVTCPDGAEFSYTVANIGDAAAGAFDVSIEATGVSETDSLSGLAAGASVTRTVAVDCVDTGYTVCADSGGAVDESNEGNNCGVSGSCTCDWNPWNDDCDITNAEISNAEYYWYTNTPINGHIITNAEISMLEYQWVTDDVC